jgi:hypothetical protein
VWDDGEDKVGLAVFRKPAINCAGGRVSCTFEGRCWDGGACV